ncbi:phosphoethanolamine--lipid A transferase [Marinobacter halodurans]|uniref:Phosphoethanolamine--lipid A transferase n=1 Tax=Marinobacter halodurans TaxID=2528979 RepID=A0ABY1ZFM7_9GAMM|nr:phosphoethanolamine--lipid A transferase [Marinobacter halodurans]TBW49528.1 phosphoethanolamine--lipid A transferase [Marinobacter halodurans]
MTKFRLILLVSAFLMLVGNQQFFTNITRVYPLDWSTLPFLASIAVVFTAALVLLLSLVCFGRSTRPILIVLLMLSSFAAYFMDSYNVVIDADMLSNVVHTNVDEASDLFSWRLVAYVLLIGVLPSVFVWRVRIEPVPFRKDLLSSAKMFGGSLALAAVLIVSLGSYYASFFREHKILRYYANPTFYIYSTIKFAGRYIDSAPKAFATIGNDAHIPPEDNDRELVIMVVGETARADHFSLNGYERDTNPRLEKENGLVNFSNFWSCGTSTQVSVPCMFSDLTRDDYSEDDAENTSNALDLLAKSGANVLWLDNNSSSKGVADRVEYHSYKSSDLNPECDEEECRDTGMLTGLDDYIRNHPKGDIFIVLHQMGNHGPAYYKRYPKEFERYTPVCRTSQLEECSEEEIINAYDNAILYTDYFLDRVIDVLKRHTPEFETAMFYLSDHGESLGEYDVYLHGLPYMIAPDEQKHIPALMWFGSSYDGVDVSELRKHKDDRFSQDNVFHTLLGLLEVHTNIYEPKMDILHSSRVPDEWEEHDASSVASQPESSGQNGSTN